MKTKFLFQRIMCALLILFIAVNVFSIPDQSVSAKPLFASFTDCASQSEIPELECNALVALYTSAGGASWMNNAGWLKTDTPCSWYGVTCNAGYVIDLNLSDNQLIGSIPLQLGKLTNLTFLNLRDNQLTGPIPPQLGNLTKLTDLYLYWNQLNGDIPWQLGSLTNLTNLYLSDNQLTGTIPWQLGNLTKLTTLYLWGNRLTGDIPPELGSLTKLTTLYLWGNQLTGSIPWQLGNLINLTDLDLSYNQLTGSIPTQLGSLTNLWSLNLSNNQLIGSIPTQLGSLTNLWFLNLSSNQLTGSIPTQLGSLTNLTDLDLSSNQLTGPIPTQPGNLTNLTDLDLSSNQLTGPIPPELGSLTNLWFLDLSSNQLTGPIPTQLGSLINLTYLDLSYNQLSGEFPTSITNLTKLTGFGFDSCQGLTSSDASVIAFLNTYKPNWNVCGMDIPRRWSTGFSLANGWTVQNYVRTVGDVSGDGKADLVGFGADGVYVAVSTGTSFGTPARWSTGFGLATGWTVQNYVRTVGDVNNDGKADLIGFGADGVYVAISTGTGFDAPTRWSTGFGLANGWTVQNSVRTVGDVSNDGRADLIGFGLDGVYVALAPSTGTSFGVPTRLSTGFGLANGWTVQNSVRTVGDVNNDGRADLIGFGLNGVYVALAPSMGTSFGVPTRLSTGFGLANGWTVQNSVRTLGDIRGDGKSDLVGFGADGVYVAVATGTGFGAVSQWSNGFGLATGWTVQDFVRTVGDVSGDGNADLVGFGLDGVYVAIAQ